VTASPELTLKGIENKPGQLLNGAERGGGIWIRRESHGRRCCLWKETDHLRGGRSGWAGDDQVAIGAGSDSHQGRPYWLDL